MRAVLAAVPLAGGDVEAVVREVQGRRGALTVPDLVAAARERARRRQILG